MGQTSTDDGLEEEKDRHHHEVGPRIFYGDNFATLRQRGARVQRPLWASTGSKNPDYSDMLYVEELIGPDTVSTIPPATLDAFRDHGQVRGATVLDGIPNAESVPSPWRPRSCLWRDNRAYPERRGHCLRVRL